MLATTSARSSCRRRTASIASNSRRALISRCVINSSLAPTILTSLSPVPPPRYPRKPDFDHSPPPRPQRVGPLRRNRRPLDSPVRHLPHPALKVHSLRVRRIPQSKSRRAATFAIRDAMNINRLIIEQEQYANPSLHLHPPFLHTASRLSH